MTEQVSSKVSITTHYTYTPPSRSPHYDVPDDPEEWEINAVHLEVKTCDKHTVVIDVTEECEDLSAALDWEHILTNIQKQING